MPDFEFTLLVAGVDVLSDESQDQLEQLGFDPPVELGYSAPGLARRSLPYRGGDFFASMRPLRTWLCSGRRRCSPTRYRAFASSRP